MFQGVEKGCIGNEWVIVRKNGFVDEILPNVFWDEPLKVIIKHNI